jgi:hypothetical protein
MRPNAGLDRKVIAPPVISLTPPALKETGQWGLVAVGRDSAAAPLAAPASVLAARALVVVDSDRGAPEPLDLAMADPPAANARSVFREKVGLRGIGHKVIGPQEIGPTLSRKPSPAVCVDLKSTAGR